MTRPIHRTDFGERLMEARKAAKLTQSQLAKKVGMSQSALAEAEKTGQGSQYLAQLAQAMGVNPVWLATGKGGKQFEPSNVSSGPKTHGPYPVISEVQAGDWTEMCENFQAEDAEQWSVSTHNLGHCGYMLRVKGKSMYAPGERYSFDEGVLLHVRPDSEPTHGQFVVVRREESKSATFKRYMLIEGIPYLVAINPDWPKELKYLPLKPGDEWCGVVVDASMGGLP